MYITPREACKKHRGKPIYEIEVHDIENRNRYVYDSADTQNVYLSLEDAKKNARDIARYIARHRHTCKLDNPDYNTEETTLVACVYSGRKVSKNGNIYGFKKIIYAVSAQTEEVTGRFIMDKRFKDLQIDEYTEQPVLTKDMFYQWED